MAKQILSGKAVREKILSGVTQLAETVIITLGPKGRNVGLDKKFVEPIVLHDGVSVAKEIELPDPFENFAAQLVRQTSAKTADRAGDGTTTSTLLAYEMIKEGIKAVDAGANPMTIKKGMEEALTEAVSYLKAKSIPINDEKSLREVATVSSGSKELGEIISKVMFKVGKDGVTTVEPSAKMETTVEYKEGMEFDKGYVSPFFSTDTVKMEAESITPHILIIDHPIQNASDLMPFMKLFTETTNRKEIVFIAPMIEGTALQTMILNKERGGVLPLGILAPSFAHRQKDILEDIAILTGATVIRKEKGMKLETTTIDQLGKAEKIWCNDKATRIIGGLGDKVKLAERVAKIREQIENEKSEFEKSQLKERLARLVSGAAVINVGGVTEVEVSEKKERVIDAVEAVKSALEEGVVIGGGVTLLQISNLLTALQNNHTVSDDYRLGYDLVRQALRKPIAKLFSNAGVEQTMIEAFDSKLGFKGYNVMTGMIEDFRISGIYDPTKVVRSGLENAVSVASLLLTTEAIVTELQVTEKSN